jgi:hypothetical protein
VDTVLYSRDIHKDVCIKAMVMLDVHGIFLSFSLLIRYSRDIPKDACKINGHGRSKHRNIFALLSVDYTIYSIGISSKTSENTVVMQDVYGIASLSSNPQNKYSIQIGTSSKTPKGRDIPRGHCKDHVH